MRSANSAGAALLVWFAAAVPLAAQEPAGSVRLLVQSAPLAGFRYHAAGEVWNELRVGDVERLRARISRLSTHPNPVRRIEFEVFIE